VITVFADAKREMIRSRVQEGTDAAIADCKRVGGRRSATRSKTLPAADSRGVRLRLRLPARRRPVPNRSVRAVNAEEIENRHDLAG
jgi:DNA invertase Pin-like site-specific DNA recombinase